MDAFLSRYRNLTLLVLVVFAQLLLLAYQVQGDRDVRLIRVWAVTAVTPAARLLESVRSAAAEFVDNYFQLRTAKTENRQLKEELDQLKMENHFLRSELATADRAQALAAFQARAQGRSVAARIIAAGTGATSKVVFVDRGSSDGVRKGMAVITPNGIVGKVLAAYHAASQVLLINDPTFAAGVLTQRLRVPGTLKGLGHSQCRVEYVPNELKVEVGEWLFTSGYDRIFPKGLPVGRVTAVREGNPFQEIYVTPSGWENGLEEVLVILEGGHTEIPDAPEPSTELHLLPPPPGGEVSSFQPSTSEGPLPGVLTDADRLRARYQRLAAAQGHTFGEGLPGSRPPDFNLEVPAGTAEEAPEPAAGTSPATPRAVNGSTGREQQQQSSPASEVPARPAAQPPPPEAVPSPPRNAN